MNNPEIARSIVASGIRTNYHDQGQGHSVLLIHGSGPGVSAWANWRLAIPELAKQARVIAPDLVGNSFGGALALALTIRHPHRVRRLVLMGSVGVKFPITPGLDAAWGYTPSLDNMRKLLGVFAHDRRLVNDELAQLRYEASIQPGFQESFSAMFPAPRQASVDAMASDEADIGRIAQQTLVIHGREDQVIPLSNSYRLAALIQRSQLHVYGQCGHWTQIEHAVRFARLVGDFLAEATADEPQPI